MKPYTRLFQEENQKSDKDLKALYDKYNKKCFGGELPDIAIIWRDPLEIETFKVIHSDVGGSPKTWSVHNLEMSPNLKGKKELLPELLHEMIHIKFVTDRTLSHTGDHGNLFKKEVDRINKMGLGFKVSEEEYLDKVEDA